MKRVCIYWSRLFLQEGSGGPRSDSWAHLSRQSRTAAVFSATLAVITVILAHLTKCRGRRTRMSVHTGTRSLSCVAFTDTWRSRDTWSPTVPPPRTGFSPLPCPLFGPVGCHRTLAARFVSLPPSAGWQPPKSSAARKDSICSMFLQSEMQPCHLFLSLPVGAHPTQQYSNRRVV